MNRSTLTTAAIIDPVCGMTVDPAHAAGSSTHDGQTYAFCSRSCKVGFDAALEKYIATDEVTASRSSCCGGHACH